jgi:hypothetical protein
MTRLMSDRNIQKLADELAKSPRDVLDQMDLSKRIDKKSKRGSAP